MALPPSFQRTSKRPPGVHGTGGPKEAELLPSIDDLLQEFPGCRISHRFAGLREVNEGCLLHHGLGEVVQLVVLTDAR